MKGISPTMAAQSSHWLGKAPVSSAWGRARSMRLSAVPIPVLPAGSVRSGLCSVRRRMGRTNVRQRSGGGCWPGAGTPSPFHSRLQRTHGSSMEGLVDYSPISTQGTKPSFLTPAVNRGILQKQWEIGASYVMHRCNARTALRVKRNWHIVWWCMIRRTSSLPTPSTSRLPFALPLSKVRLLGGNAGMM